MTRRRLEPAAQPAASDGKPELEAVLEHYGVSLTSRTSQMARCMFHQDDTPSLSVNLDKQVYRCHSCGEAGDAYTLIGKMEGTNDFERQRAFAAAKQFATRSPDGSDGNLRGGTSAGRYGRSLPAGSGDRGADRPYIPRWRSGRSDAGA